MNTLFLSKSSLLPLNEIPVNENDSLPHLCAYIYGESIGSIVMYKSANKQTNMNSNWQTEQKKTSQEVNRISHCVHKNI